MRQQAGSDNLAEGDGNGVADQPADGLLANLFSRSSELVIRREALQDRAFSERNSSVLLRMAETAVTKPEELRRHRRGGSVPGHAAINAGVGLPGKFLVAVGHQLPGPVTPCPPRPGSFYAAHIDFGKSGALV